MCGVEICPPRRACGPSITGGGRRRGAAVVEFAICLPLLLVLSIVPMELASMLYLRQTLQQAAYETAREATKKFGTEANAIAKSSTILTERGTQAWQLQIAPDLDTVSAGEYVTVTISADYGPNAFVGLRFLDKHLSSSITMLKE